MLLLAPLLLQHKKRDERRGDTDGGYADVEASSVRERVERLRKTLELRFIHTLVTGHFSSALVRRSGWESELISHL